MNNKLLNNRMLRSFSRKQLWLCGALILIGIFGFLFLCTRKFSEKERFEYEAFMEKYNKDLLATQFLIELDSDFAREYALKVLKGEDPDLIWDAYKRSIGWKVTGCPRTPEDFESDFKVYVFLYICYLLGCFCILIAHIYNISKVDRKDERVSA